MLLLLLKVYIYSTNGFIQEMGWPYVAQRLSNNIELNLVENLYLVFFLCSLQKWN